MRCTTRVLAIVAVLSVLLASSLACAMTVQGPTPPGSPIPVSTAAAGQLASLWQEAKVDPATGKISVVVTETQLTSFLSYKLAEWKDAPISNPQAYLRNNRIELYGTAAAASITTTVSAAFSTTVNADGAIELQVASANFGPVPVPPDLLTRLSLMINEGLTGSLGQMATGVKLTSVVIRDGRMTITGIAAQP
jgi:hypothetical protein